MKATLLTISDSDKHFSSAIDEYIKRLSKSVTIKNLKPTKYGSQEQIIQAETKTLQSAMKSGIQTLILNPAGDQRATTDRTTHLYGKNTQLIIGGPYGIDYSQFPSMQHVSLGSQTMPHGLAKLVLLEQLYRVQCIGQGKRYHY